MPSDTVQELLEDAKTKLAEAGCETPLLDARLLLQHAAGFSREDIILLTERVLEESTANNFAELIARRAAREPVSRILGEREFYGRVFQVTPSVLDPRPDTETLIDAGLGILHGPLHPTPRSGEGGERQRAGGAVAPGEGPHPSRAEGSARHPGSSPGQALPHPLGGEGKMILDLGTGSGAIIVTLLAECPDAIGVASDLSLEALAVARANAERLGVADRLQFVHGDWFSPVSGRFDLIVSNPPYIPAQDIAALSPDVRDFDPALALAGGADGLDPYRHIAAGAASHLRDGGTVLVEIGAGQAEAVEAIFAAAKFRPAARHFDLGRHVRCLMFGQP